MAQLCPIPLTYTQITLLIMMEHSCTCGRVAAQPYSDESEQESIYNFT